MCGIVGCTGNRNATPLLIEGLSKLEYKGYDFAGRAVRDGESRVQIVKAKDRLKHGTISLIENGTLVVCLLTQLELLDKMVSNMVKFKSRGTYLMGLTSYGNYNVENTEDFTV